MQRGFATLEIISAITVIAVLMSIALPNVNRIIDSVALDYETKSLYSELRFLQSLSRSGRIDVDGTGRTFDDNVAPSLQISPNKLTWQVLRGNTPIRDAHQMQRIKSIKFKAAVPLNRITFDTAGNADVVSNSLILTSRLGKTSKIVFDSVGRFRGGRDDE